MIDARYAVTREEWGEAQTIWGKRRTGQLPGQKFVQWINVLLGVAIGLSLSYLPWWVTGVFGLWFCLNFVFSRWRKKAIRDYLYSQATDRNEMIEMQIGETGYSSSRPGFNECRMAWQCFTGWKEGTTVFILGRSVQFCIIPKRALTDAQEIELRNLLQAKLADA